MSSTKSSGKAKAYGAALGKVGDALNKSYEGKNKQGNSGKPNFGRQLSTGTEADKRKNRSGSLMRQTSFSSQPKNKDKKTTGTRV